MTKEEKEKAQKLLDSLNENIFAMKEETLKAELLLLEVRRTLVNIKPVEKPQRNRRK